MLSKVMKPLSDTTLLEIFWRNMVMIMLYLIDLILSILYWNTFVIFYKIHTHLNNKSSYYKLLKTSPINDERILTQDQ